MAGTEKIDVSQALEQLVRLPAGLRYLILSGVALAIMVLYGVTLYKGVSQELGALEGQLSDLHTKIAESRAVAANLKSFELRQQELSAELEVALESLPNSRELPVLLTDISSLGKKSGLEIRLFRPEAEINRGFYAEVPINVEFLGRYHEAGIFFDRLSRLSRVVNVTELEMTLADPKADIPTLKVRGIATTFRFVEQPKTVNGGQ